MARTESGVRIGWWLDEGRSCRRKIAWSEEDALLIAIHDRQMSGHPNIAAYNCRRCGMFHIGHMNNRHLKVWGCDKCHNIVARRHFDKHHAKCTGYSPIERPLFYPRVSGES